MLSKYNEFNLWMDKVDLQGGLKWRPAIRKAIRESDFFISILSSQSIKGRGERNKEIYEALDELKKFPPTEVYLIPTLIDECDPPFEEMRDLNWVKLFPEWDTGVDSLLSALGVKKPVKKLLKEVKPKTSSSNYHYRIGMVDLDMGLVNIREILSQLNKVQRYFLFTNPEMPVVKRVTEVIGGIKNFCVHKVPKTYIGEHRHLSVDLVACITKYPLAFEEDEQILYNYFAGPSNQDERFMFISADNLYEYCKQAGCVFEEGIVSLLVSQLVAYFTEIDYHEATRKCVMDFCENRDDLVYSLKSRAFCKQCNRNLPEGELKESLLKLLNWKYE